MIIIISSSSSSSSGLMCIIITVIPVAFSLFLKKPRPRWRALICPRPEDGSQLGGTSSGALVLVQAVCWKDRESTHKLELGAGFREPSSGLFVRTLRLTPLSSHSAAHS